jgi:hypothetical protein
LASSSAMMRRIDARISSIEGSWTFAGCVISDSTSSTPSHAFYTKHDRILPIPDVQAGIFTAQPDLSPDQAPLDTSRGIPPLQGNQASHPNDAGCGANRSATYDKGMSWQQSIASKALAHESPKHALRQTRRPGRATRGPVTGSARLGAPDDRYVGGYGDQRPSGTRTPYQLSRT